MSNAMTPEHEEQKKAIFERLSPRRKKFIDRIGYDKWDPFQLPKDPIEIRTDVTRRTTQQLFRDFMHETQPDNYSAAYGQSVLEFCLTLVSRDERCRGVFDFCLWYKELLDREGKSFWET
ncbi:MAG: hypothetical protein EOM25_01150 [Deltaproteobacteria bacterium]|nr:hypothetical protein [Deltaproteobacteria bacterium]